MKGKPLAKWLRFFYLFFVTIFLGAAFVFNRLLSFLRVKSTSLLGYSNTTNVKTTTKLNSSKYENHIKEKKQK